MSTRITKKIIDQTPYPKEGQAFLRDNLLPGFAVRLTKNTKTFVLEKRMLGRVRRITIGPYGPIAVNEARRRAMEMIGQIALGEDPASEIVSRKHEPTFGDLISLYRKDHIALKKPETKQLYEGIIKNHLNKLRNRKLSAITQDVVLKLYKKIGAKTPYMANRMLAVVRNMFNKARFWKLFKGDNPTTGIPRLFKEVSRDRFVHGEELPRIIRSLSQEGSIIVKAVILIYLFTGARKQEVLTMRWEDLNLMDGVWRLPDTKTGSPHYLPLISPAISILNTLPRYVDNPYVFPGRYGRGRMINISKPWGRIRKRAGVPDIRIHDLRRTVGSWLAGSGESLPLIGKVLNHSQPSTTAVYARLQLDPVRKALERNAKKMIEIGKIEIG